MSSGYDLYTNDPSINIPIGIGISFRLRPTSRSASDVRPNSQSHENSNVSRHPSRPIHVLPRIASTHTHSSSHTPSASTARPAPARRRPQRRPGRTRQTRSDLPLHGAAPDVYRKPPSPG